ncbi:MAG: hypothetical protein ACXWIU_03250, partial [Limisphaerales bacterium]
QPVRPATHTIKPSFPKASATSNTALNMPALAVCGGVDVWITPAQACKILGIAPSGIYRLVDPTRPFLVAKRPLPRKILISLRSVRALSEATKNPDFWESQPLQKQLSAKLQAIVEHKE